MANNIEMPRLSDTMSEGTIAKWRKQVGEPVAKGDIIVEIETDKATMDLEAFQAGILGKILVQEGDTVAIGVPIAILVQEGEAVPDAAPPAAATPKPAAEPAPAPAVAAAPTTPAPTAVAAAPTPAPLLSSGRVRVSPLARRVAEENGIDLRMVTGTGPSGRIIRADVEAAARSGSARAGASGGGLPGIQVTSYPPMEGDTEDTPNTLQQVVVRRMMESKFSQPEFFVTSEIDMTEAVALRKSINAALPEGKGVSFNDMIVRAAGVALQSHPRVNGSYADGKFRVHHQYNVGIAVAMPDGGLVVPVVRDVPAKGLAALAAEAKDLIERARGKKLALTEMEGSCISISNMGMYDVDQFTAIINQPNSAILAVGAIVKKPVVKNDQIVIAERMRITMTSDHRIVYGADAALYLREVKRLLEQPVLLMV